ncbi:MAG: helix-turn-helix domain-containing protein [Lachnospiraceae bacterium]|nr:helix-turn-helix domain-containing protein [Lachnospiraceae bacterium]
MENKNRLMSIPEFQEYAGGIGRNTALNLSRDAKVRVQIGRRVLIDRVKFDEWVSENTTG